MDTNTEYSYMHGKCAMNSHMQWIFI